MKNSNNNDGMMGGLPININKEVPTPNGEAKSIVAVVKHSGEITGYELSNGERISKQDAVKRAREGYISGVAIGVSKKGEEYLRSLPDDDEGNNLSSLPIIKD